MMSGPPHPGPSTFLRRAGRAENKASCAFLRADSSPARTAAATAAALPKIGREAGGGPDTAAWGPLLTHLLRALQGPPVPGFPETGRKARGTGGHVSPRDSQGHPMGVGA